jgi:hypothetical protein
MILEDLKDQFVDRAQALWSQIQESSSYIRISEKYSDMNPAAQKASLIGGSIVALLLILIFPLSYISSSNDSLQTFESKKTLLRELFRVSRASRDADAAPPTVNSAELINKAQNQLRLANLPPDQIKSVSEFDNSLPQSGTRPLPSVPKEVQQKGIEVSLAKLNLRQVVEIGFQLQAMDRSLKMMGLSIDADQADPHYFNVIYQLVSFSLPTEIVESGKDSKAKNARGKKTPKPKATTEPSGDE